MESTLQFSSNTVTRALEKTTSLLSRMESHFSQLTTSVEDFTKAFDVLTNQEVLEKMCENTTKVEKSLIKARHALKSIQSEFSDTTKIVNSALSSISQLTSRVVDVGELPSMADSLTESNARLSFLVEDSGSVQALRDDILGVAEASRTSYTDLMQAVSNLGFAAGDAFASNDEIVAFAELMNKGFAVSGTKNKEW